MRKLRLWRCPCCGRNSRRVKDDVSSMCFTCRIEMVAARTYGRNKRPCQHLKPIVQREKELAKFGTKPRTVGKKLFKVTPELNNLWADVRKARTRPAFQRRGQKFIEALAKDMKWSPPKLEITEDHPYVYGQYSRSFDKGHTILITTKKIKENPKLWELESIRRTFVHELQHYLDAEAGLNDRGHGHYWQIRLNRLEKLLPFTEYGSTKYENRK